MVPPERGLRRVRRSVASAVLSTGLTLASSTHSIHVGKARTEREAAIESFVNGCAYLYA